MPAPENPFVVVQDGRLARLGRVSAPAGSPASFYDDWRLAETEATLALAAWSAAARDQKPAAYARYVTRTDAEEAAALRLHERLGQTRD